MKIILDGMGGDNAPAAMVEGAVEAAKLTNHKICIVGNEEEIIQEFNKHNFDINKVEIRHASEVIENTDPPVKAIRTKKDSSLVVGLKMVKEGEGDILISAGNTGALMAGGLFIYGRIQGIDRPAIATTYPILGKSSGRNISLLLDSGANSECKPNNLLEFALMGSIYMEKVLNVENPEIGLINMGVEENKGTTVLKATYELLEKSRDIYGSLNFIGNVEARDVPKGKCDVLVCDGFVGNVILKLTEGLAWNILSMLKQKFTSGIIPKIGAAFLAGKMREIKSEFDYSEYGGAPILGVKGGLLKIHGSSNANAVKNCILKSVPYVENDIVNIIQSSVVELEEIEAGD